MDLELFSRYKVDKSARHAGSNMYVFCFNLSKSILCYDMRQEDDSEKKKRERKQSVSFIVKECISICNVIFIKKIIFMLNISI